MSFTTKQLKTLAYNANAFDHGVDLFLNDSVSDLEMSYDLSTTLSTPPINIEAKVILNTGDSLTTNIKLLDTKLLSMKCSCDNFLKTSNACSHLLATLLQFSDDHSYWLSKLPHLHIPSADELSPLTTKIFLDTEGLYITASILWEYPNSTINAVSKTVTGHSKLTKRDKQAELEIKNLIGKYHFDLYKTDLLYLYKNNDIYDFLRSGVDELKSFCHVATSSSFDQLLTTSIPESSLDVQLVDNELHLNIEHSNMANADLQGMLSAYAQGDSYYRLSSGHFIHFDNISSTELSHFSYLEEVLKSLIPLGINSTSNKIVLPAYRGLYLDQVLSHYSDFSYSKNNAFHQLIHDIKHAKSTDYKIPDTLNATLRDYQITGYKWLKSLSHYKLGGILADDMGLGKTIQTICLLLSDREQVEHPSLIVCPTSLVLNWQHELNTFAPSLKVLTLIGNARKREELLDEIDNYDIILTSYDLLTRDVSCYQNLKFHYCIADEAHYIKSRRTLKSKALKAVNSQIRFALTGTPIENSLTELWSIFDFIMPGYLFNHNVFQIEFGYPITKANDQDQAALLQKMIAPFILRRLKRDVLKELPEKTESICYIPMTAQQEHVYQTYSSTALNELNTEIASLGFNRSHIKFLSLLTRLRQVCCHPKLCLPQYTGDSGKLDACLELVTTSIESGHKVLIFSQFTSMLDILASELTTLGISYYTLRGNTPSSKRLELVNNFNEGTTQVFLISLKAGGIGLNLTSADIVIHYDPWWNVSAQNQATDRAHRIGQLNPVQVYKLITQDSIEEKIELLQQHKSGLTEQFLQRGETFLHQLTEEDVLNLFRL